MQRTINASPERLFAEATAFMVSSGASVGGQTESSITFVARQGLDAMGQALGILGSLGDFGGTMSALTAYAVSADQRSTLVAIPQGAQTSVTISDNQDLASNLLRFWFVANVLRESLPNPMQKIQASYHKVLIFNDRIESYSRVMSWKLRATIQMADVASVETTKRLVTIRTTDGREVSIKALTKEEADKAKGIIQSRRAVYSAPRVKSAPPADMAEAPARYCSNCGRGLSPEDRFCTNCGRPVFRTASPGP